MSFPRCWFHSVSSRRDQGLAATIISAHLLAMAASTAAMPGIAAQPPSDTKEPCALDLALFNSAHCAGASLPRLKLSAQIGASAATKALDTFCFTSASDVLLVIHPPQQKPMTAAAAPQISSYNAGCNCSGSSIGVSSLNGGCCRHRRICHCQMFRRPRGRRPDLKQRCRRYSCRPPLGRAECDPPAQSHRTNHYGGHVELRPVSRDARAARHPT